jgi:[ribosomal protein S5]-alanine N-acetyltransferase
MIMPEIRTERLTLRPPTMDDLDGFAAAWGDADVMRYLPGGRARTREQVAASLPGVIGHWQERGFGFWSLVLKDGGRWIGYCGLRYLRDVDETEIAYGILKEFWNQGLTTEAAHAALRHGFETLGLDRIVAYADPENCPSMRVMEHIGMHFEENVHIFGLDCVRYAIARAEFQPPAAPYHLHENAGD